jgi:hypothetical protein
MPKFYRTYRKVLYELAAVRYRLLSRDSGFVTDNSGAVVVYPSAGLVYNRIKKSGNSSVVLYLRDAIDGRPNLNQGKYLEDKRSSIHFGRHPFKLAARDILKIDQYFSFTIMRNPYSRCLSAFLDKVAAGGRGFSKVPGFGRNDTGAFEDFVTFLECGGLYYDRHFWPQVDLLFWPPQRFSYIGHLEKLEAELRHVFNAVNISVPASMAMKEPHPSEKQKTGKVTGAHSKVDNYYTEQLFSRVRNLYERDFKVGGYNSDWAARE